MRGDDPTYTRVQFAGPISVWMGWTTLEIAVQNAASHEKQARSR